MKKFIAVLLGIALVALTFVFVRTKDLNIETEDVSLYGNWDGLLGKTNLLIFPEDLPEYDEDIEYYHYNQASDLGPSCCVFLKCSYNTDDYEKELSRLKAVPLVKYDEKNYSYDAFVTIDTKFEDEYALLCEDNTIVYIFRKDGIRPAKPLEDRYSKKNDVDGNFTVYNYDNYNDFIYWPDSWK